MKHVILIALLTVAAAVSGQDGLYAPSVPEDAALVRVVNATSQAVTVDIGPLRFREVPAYSASAYRPLQPDVFLIVHAGLREVVTPTAKAFLSVVLLPDAIHTIADERHTDPARAQLVVYNFADEPVAFRALEPDALLADGVAPASSAVRVVNAMPIELGAVADGTIFSASLRVERGKSYALVVLGTDSDPAGFVVQAGVSSE
ncbi:MAG: alginate O-acetyltransferase AlgF [Spirochaetales bacterium]